MKKNKEKKKEKETCFYTIACKKLEGLEFKNVNGSKQTYGRLLKNGTMEKLVFSGMGVDYSIAPIENINDLSGEEMKAGTFEKMKVRVTNFIAKEMGIEQF